MTIKEFAVFLLECFLAMMFVLVGDVIAHSGNIGF